MPEEQEQPKPQDFRGDMKYFSGVQSPEVMRLRLDPNEALNNFKAFLLGKEIIYIATNKNKEGYIKIEEDIGESKMNNEGINDIMSWLKNAVSASTVQGNFPVDNFGHSPMYSEHMFYLHKDFGLHLMKKRIDFSLSDNEYKGIVDKYMVIVRPFYTRLIGNEERKSYAETVKSIESATYGRPEGQKKRWSLFGFRRT